MVLSAASGAAVTGQCLWLGLSHYPTVNSLGLKVIQVATVLISRAPKPAPMTCISLRHAARLGLRNYLTSILKMRKLRLRKLPLT